ncbi:potassium channel family protein [Herbiconiux sp. SYSU D00978]|uniref:potassium channel family protein n=1 Tax=Herbiconiux sp. SYSU D00978 TaxID=2812562 RepID=UPI001A965069|nr:potassium channel family protein [Herbiconiux sp. SYSU D00978]
MTALGWLSVAFGGALVLTGLYEVYRTLLHPTGRGRITKGVASAAWWVMRRTGRNGVPMAGPFVILAVLITWAAFQVVGWAFVYLPAMPDGFLYTQGLDPARYLPPLEAVYISMVTLSTLGIGDLTPVYPWLRVVMPFEAIVGFALLTAAVAWFMELYPGIGRRRALAQRIALLEHMGAHRELAAMDEQAAASLLDRLTTDLVQTQVDLSQNEEVFYFSSGHRDSSLAANLPYCLVLARQAVQSRRVAVQLAGRMLEDAVHSYAHFLRSELLVEGATTEHVLAEYARQHGIVL